MRLSRSDVVGSLLAAASVLRQPPPAFAAAAMSFVQADDKSFDFRLPSAWRLDPAPPRSEFPERLLHVRAARDDARLDVTVSFAKPGVSSLKDLGSIDKVAQSCLSRLPSSATLASAEKLPRPDLFSAGMYEFRFRTADGRVVQRVALQQGRLYELSATLPADAPEPLQQEVDEVVASFKAFPLNIGCLQASNRGGSLVPGVCY